MSAKPKTQNILLRLLSLTLILIGALLLYSTTTTASELKTITPLFYTLSLILLTSGLIPLIAKLQ